MSSTAATQHPRVTVKLADGDTPYSLLAMMMTGAVDWSNVHKYDVSLATTPTGKSQVSAEACVASFEMPLTSASVRVPLDGTDSSVHFEDVPLFIRGQVAVSRNQRIIVGGPPLQGPMYLADGVRASELSRTTLFPHNAQGLLPAVATRLGAAAHMGEFKELPHTMASGVIATGSLDGARDPTFLADLVEQKATSARTIDTEHAALAVECMLTGVALHIAHSEEEHAARDAHFASWWYDHEQKLWGALKDALPASSDAPADNWTLVNTSL